MLQAFCPPIFSQDQAGISVFAFAMLDTRDRRKPRVPTRAKRHSAMMRRFQSTGVILLTLSSIARDPGGVRTRKFRSTGVNPHSI